MVLKSVLRKEIKEVLTDNDVDDKDVWEAVLDRMVTLVEVYDDDDEQEQEKDQEQEA